MKKDLLNESKKSRIYTCPNCNKEIHRGQTVIEVHSGCYTYFKKKDMEEELIEAYRKKMLEGLYETD